MLPSFDLPPAPPPIQVNHECLIGASYYYQIPPEILLAIRIQEGGKPGFERTNKNGTRDLGTMQINTVHRETFSVHGITEDQLKNDECVNLYAGAYILHRELRATPDFWQGVGRYHSRTPSLRDGYAAKIKERFLAIQAKHRDYFYWLRTVLLPRILNRSS